MALLIYRLGSTRAQYWFRVAFHLTLCLPGIVGILTWSNFYEIGGVIDLSSATLGSAGLDDRLAGKSPHRPGRAIFMGFPWVARLAMLVFYAGLQAIPTRNP